MARALQLAERGYYSAKPNPRVGCVLVKDDRIIGEGYHYAAGKPHAEIEALRNTSEPRGATAYVTLEPCCHHGRTPPCANALIEAGIARVVYAVGDPNPRVDGGGAARLLEAGIEVCPGVMAEAAEQLNRGFFRRMRAGVPFVTVKLGMSLDARTALPSGESQWITSSCARGDVQRLRAEAGAVITGRGTIIADDPSLTVRDGRFDIAGVQPLRVVLDTELRAKPPLKLFETPGEVLVFTASDDDKAAAAFRNAGADVDRVPRAGHGLDLAVILKRLAARNINDVLVEAGPTLAAAFIGGDFADEIVAYVAPKILGNDAMSAFALPAPPTLGLARDFEFVDVRRLGVDLRLTLAPLR
jgi:diaminohydroxyphosphoribosylaminopyrimidine deaminase/5-amino-6-(5-phosphoribosylamino)uracil reductase